MTTSARPTSDQASHYYYPDGRPCYEVENKSKGGMRKTTLADCKKLGLIPSVTTILSVLDRPALTAWKVEQGVLAALTTPRNPGEELDAFVYRVLHEERQQDQEAQKAMDRGTEIHDALECYFTTKTIRGEIKEWIEPVIDFLESFGTVEHTEHIMVGNGYAGKTDLIIRDKTGQLWIIDFKTSRKIPKESYWEHKMQTAAYLSCTLDCFLYDRHRNQNHRRHQRGIIMPFKSEKQRRFMWSQHPDIAEAWAHGKSSTTGKKEFPAQNKGLPMRKRHRKKRTVPRPDSRGFY